MYLVVDDDQVFRERLGQAILSSDNQVALADSAQQALILAKELRPERAIVDLRMPQHSGLQLIEWLKDLDPSMEVVVLTGFGSIVTTQEALKRGARSYLIKPTPLEQILAAFEPQPQRVAPQDEIPSLQQVEWDYLNRVLMDFGGNVTHAAKALGINRRSLQRRLAKAPKVS